MVMNGLFKPYWMGPRKNAYIPSISMSQLVDSFNREHTYLRISLTEKCNLRCKYCMPEQGVVLTPREKLLGLEERKRLIQFFGSMGVKKLRFTGGEPTVSPQLHELIAFSRQHVDHIAITSNGILLREMLPRLKDAGMGSLNISLDTLSEHKFSAITRREGRLIGRVLSSIYAAAAMGLPVKVNCVLMRGFNDEEMGEFVKLTQDLPVDVRFIELMPFEGNEWDPKKFISYREVVDRLVREQGVELLKEPVSSVHDTTKWYRSSSTSQGRIGFITSMSSHFCEGCNRLRITADGKLKVCLFGKEEADLLLHLRSGASDDDLQEIVQASVLRKKAKLGGYDNMSALAADTSRPMILIGG